MTYKSSVALPKCTVATAALDRNFSRNKFSDASEFGWLALLANLKQSRQLKVTACERHLSQLVYRGHNDFVVKLFSQYEVY